MVKDSVEVRQHLFLRLRSKTEVPFLIVLTNRYRRDPFSPSTLFTYGN